MKKFLILTIIATTILLTSFTGFESVLLITSYSILKHSTDLYQINLATSMINDVHFLSIASFLFIIIQYSTYFVLFIYLIIELVKRRKSNEKRNK